MSRDAMPTSAKSSDSNPSRRRLRSAGISRRRVRSPVAPKITSVQGGAGGAVSVSAMLSFYLVLRYLPIMGFNTILVVMGVSGSGKTTVAAMLAGALGVGFLEGDGMHPKTNVEKMK